MSKQITCPKHGTHQATLHVWPEEFAGVWDCNADDETSDFCEHEDLHIEEIEVDMTRNGEHDTYKTKIEVCDACECEAE